MVDICGHDMSCFCFMLCVQPYLPGFMYMYTYIYIYLIGGFKHVFFSIINGIFLPIDELIFFKMVIAPPTFV